MDILKKAREYQGLCIKLRRDLHKIPETGLILPKTSNYIKNLLKKWRIDYEDYIDGNGIAVIINKDKRGSCLGIRCDMDALPVHEKTGLDFRSIHEGKMHACGHDAHMAVGLTVLKIMLDNPSIFKTKVKFIFQPGEEFPGGAKRMIEEGCLKNPNVDYIFGMHQGCLFDDLQNGQFGIKTGTIMASMDTIKAKIIGKGGHGAIPEDCVDPILITGEIIESIQKIISREISPTTNALISICEINAGTSQNVIPDECRIRGTIRTLDNTTRTYIEKRLNEMITMIAKANRAKVEIEYERFYPPTINDIKFTSKIKQILKREIGEGKVQELKTATMAGDDFAFYLQEIPGCYLMLANGKISQEGRRYPHHSNKFDIDENYLGEAVEGVLSIVLGCDE